MESRAHSQPRVPDVADPQGPWVWPTQPRARPVQSGPASERLSLEPRSPLGGADGSDVLAQPVAYRLATPRQRTYRHLRPIHPRLCGLPRVSAWLRSRLQASEMAAENALAADGCVVPARSEPRDSFRSQKRAVHAGRVAPAS